ncbi:hypothetical protein GQ42DRAFT_153459 [Ramicandelaber brevisporus]|nr:hypothetical protein GQ42DRAFT_153459 [Ramicandelaber brevisporus]
MSDSKVASRKRGHASGTAASSTTAARSAKRAAPSSSFESHFIDSAISECAAISSPPPTTDSDANFVRDTRHQSWWKTKADVLAVKDVTEPNNLLLHTWSGFLYRIDKDASSASASKSSAASQTLTLQPFVLKRCTCTAALFGTVKKKTSTGIGIGGGGVMGFGKSCSYTNAHALLSRSSKAQFTGWKCVDSATGGGSGSYMFDVESAFQCYLDNFASSSSSTHAAFKDSEVLSQYVDRWLEFVFVSKSTGKFASTNVASAPASQHLNGTFYTFLKVDAVRQAIGDGEIFSLQPLFCKDYCNQIGTQQYKDSITFESAKCQSLNAFKSKLVSLEDSASQAVESVAPNTLPYSSLSFMLNKTKNTELSDKYDEHHSEKGKTRLIQLGSQGSFLDITTGILYSSLIFDSLPREQSRLHGGILFVNRQKLDPCCTAFVEHIAATRDISPTELSTESSAVIMPVQSTLIVVENDKMAHPWITAISNYNKTASKGRKLQCSVISLTDFKLAQMRDVVEVDIVLLILGDHHSGFVSNDNRRIDQNYSYDPRFEYTRNKPSTDDDVNSNSGSTHPLFASPAVLDKYTSAIKGKTPPDLGGAVDSDIAHRLASRKVFDDNRGFMNVPPPDFYTSAGGRVDRERRQEWLDTRNGMETNTTSLRDYEFGDLRFRRIITFDVRSQMQTVVNGVTEPLFGYMGTADVKIDVMIHDGEDSNLHTKSADRKAINLRLAYLYEKQDISVSEFELLAKRRCIRF